MQGESDAVLEDKANAYERNLRVFFQDLTKDLSKIWEQDASSMPVVIGGIHPNYANMPYADTVIAAQKKIASAHENYYFFSTADLNVHDGWHYTGNSGYEMGRRFAESLIAGEGYGADLMLMSEASLFFVKKIPSASLFSDEKINVPPSVDSSGGDLSASDFPAPPSAGTESSLSERSGCGSSLPIIALSGFACCMVFVKRKKDGR